MGWHAEVIGDHDSKIMRHMFATRALRSGLVWISNVFVTRQDVPCCLTLSTVNCAPWRSLLSCDYLVICFALSRPAVAYFQLTCLVLFTEITCWIAWYNYGLSNSTVLPQWCYCLRWPWLTFKIFCLLQVFSGAIFHRQQSVSYTHLTLPTNREV